MNIDNLIEETAKAIRDIEDIQDTEVFEEDKGDISQKIETSVADVALHRRRLERMRIRRRRAPERSWRS